MPQRGVGHLRCKYNGTQIFMIFMIKYDKEYMMITAVGAGLASARCWASSMQIQWNADFHDFHD